MFKDRALNVRFLICIGIDDETQVRHAAFEMRFNGVRIGVSLAQTEHSADQAQTNTVMNILVDPVAFRPCGFQQCQSLLLLMALVQFILPLFQTGLQVLIRE